VTIAGLGRGLLEMGSTMEGAFKSSWKILIADDHELIRRGTRALLESRGRIEVWEAKNGKEAVEKTRELKPDLVILDISMPVLDGFSAARAIRKFAPDIEILIVSVNKTEMFADIANRIGVSGYLTKSEGSRALLEAVEGALKNRETRARPTFLPASD
jgi:DNA-binding NarL/FixJ family response regulator